MKVTEFNRIKDDISWIFEEHVEGKKCKFTPADKETLRYPDSPTYDIKSGSGKTKVQVTYWKQYENMRGTVKQYKVEDRSVVITCEYRNANYDLVTRHITVSFQKRPVAELYDSEVGRDVVFDVHLKVNNHYMCSYKKTFKPSTASPENWNDYNSKGLRYRLYWEMFGYV